MNDSEAKTGTRVRLRMLHHGLGTITRAPYEAVLTPQQVKRGVVSGTQIDVLLDEPYCGNKLVAVSAWHVDPEPGA